MPTELRKTQVNLRITPTLKAAAVKAAKADQRSLNSFIEKCLVDHLRSTGFLKGAK